ncbi:hypothetical protein LTS18_011033, partial [Coniosporium uncinatum]
IEDEDAEFQDEIKGSSYRTSMRSQYSLPTGGGTTAAQSYTTLPMHDGGNNYYYYNNSPYNDQQDQDQEHDRIDSDAAAAAADADQIYGSTNRSARPSRTKSIQSTRSSLHNVPFGARVHRASWSTQDLARHNDSRSKHSSMEFGSSGAHPSPPPPMPTAAETAAVLEGRRRSSRYEGEETAMPTDRLMGGEDVGSSASVYEPLGYDNRQAQGKRSSGALSMMSASSGGGRGRAVSGAGSVSGSGYGGAAANASPIAPSSSSLRRNTLQQRQQAENETLGRRESKQRAREVADRATQ